MIMNKVDRIAEHGGATAIDTCTERITKLMTAAMATDKNQGKKERQAER